MSIVGRDVLRKIEESIDEKILKDEFKKKWEVIEIKDWVASVTGLEDAMFSELVEFENGTKGLVLELLNNMVGVLVLGDYTTISQGDVVSKTNKVLSTWVGQQYLWRVLDGLWNPIDGKEEPKPDDYYPVENKAAWIIDRKSVDQSLETGLKAVDSMIPIGRGQRELIIWDRQTGKTTVAIDTILNQKWKNIKCIYVAIWQKDSNIRRVVTSLKEAGAMDYTVVINASVNSPSVNQYIAPYVGCSIWEYFMDKWEHALIIYDDLSKHAVAYREVSLLLRRPPGREAYPWDIFYSHSRLLERAAKLSDEKWGGSLTALPIIETQEWDVSWYIPTNVISITDGQISLDTNLFAGWTRPAIDVWISVSRVWWSAQTKIMKKVAGKLRLELATYRELAAFSQFASDLDESTQNKLKRWERMVEMLKQSAYSPIPFYKQVVFIYWWINWYFDELELENIAKFEKVLYERMDTTYKKLADKIKEEQTMSEEIEEKIKFLLDDVLKELK